MRAGWQTPFSSSDLTKGTSLGKSWFCTSRAMASSDSRRSSFRSVVIAGNHARGMADAFQLQRFDERDILGEELVLHFAGDGQLRFQALLFPICSNRRKPCARDGRRLSAPAI